MMRRLLCGVYIIGPYCLSHFCPVASFSCGYNPWFLDNRIYGRLVVGLRIDL